MKKTLLLLAFFMLILMGCSKNDNSTPILGGTLGGTLGESEDEVLLSFVFVGCNRMKPDGDNKDDIDDSTANKEALKRIFNEVANLENKPKYFFFLGDLIQGKVKIPDDPNDTSELDKLDKALEKWVSNFEDPDFSDMPVEGKGAGIKMYAVPGNHELLTNKHDKDGNKMGEIPVKGASERWWKHMQSFMPVPGDRDSMPDTEDKINNMTYAFKDGNTGFIIINTDTYNPNEKEGFFPYDWVKETIDLYRQDANIEHIFVLGHKPFYFNCEKDSLKDGDASLVWDKFEASNVAAMLSAHQHTYQRMQPNEKTHQIVAGNGGSPIKLADDSLVPPSFFGYTQVDVMSSGKLLLKTFGYKSDDKYYKSSTHDFCERDSANLNWYSADAIASSSCEVVKGESSCP